MTKVYFAGDNYASASTEILDAMCLVMRKEAGHHFAYGSDVITQLAKQRVASAFNRELVVSSLPSSSPVDTNNFFDMFFYSYWHGC